MSKPTFGDIEIELHHRYAMQDVSERIRMVVLHSIDEHISPIYGQFPELDRLIDKFRQDVENLELT